MSSVSIPHKPHRSGINTPTPDASKLQFFINNKSTDHINKGFYFRATEEILNTFYPVVCQACETVMDKTIPSRPYSIRCRICHTQKSRLSHTPLNHMKLPLWMFGYLFLESIGTYPQPITTASLSKKLNISYGAALLLKRRFQIFCSERMEGMREIFREKQAEKFKGTILPDDPSTDLRPYYKATPPINLDSMALFSASQRANKGRKRYKHTGMTASIYLSDNLGGKQVGSLFQTIVVKNGPVFLYSVPNLSMGVTHPHTIQTLRPLMLLTADNEYKWLPYKNLRLVNHSRKSSSKKGRWSKYRWVTEQGVHSNTAEGIQSVFKTSMRNYRWFSPKYSQLYANEWCFLRNIKFYGMTELAQAGRCGDSDDDPLCSNSSPSGRIVHKVAKYLYHAPDMEQRKKYSSQDKIEPLPDVIFQQKQYHRLRKEMERYKAFTASKQKNWRKTREKQYNHLARTIWKQLVLSDTEWSDLNLIISNQQLPRRTSLRLVRVWKINGLIEIADKTDYSGENVITYRIKPKIDVLPDMLYIQDNQERNRISREFSKTNKIKSRRKQQGRRKRFI